MLCLIKDFSYIFETQLLRKVTTLFYTMNKHLSNSKGITGTVKRKGSVYILKGLLSYQPPEYIKVRINNSLYIFYLLNTILV